MAKVAAHHKHLPLNLGLFVLSYLLFYVYEIIAAVYGLAALKKVLYFFMFVIALISSFVFVYAIRKLSNKEYTHRLFIYGILLIVACVIVLIGQGIYRAYITSFVFSVTPIGFILHGSLMSPFIGLLFYLGFVFLISEVYYYWKKKPGFKKNG